MNNTAGDIFANHRKLVPSLMRTLYIDAATGEDGVPEAEWEGMASAMGNTKRTWTNNYAPTYRRTKMRKSIPAHVDFRNRILGNKQ